MWQASVTVAGPAQGMGSKRLLPRGGKPGAPPVLVNAADGKLRRWQRALKAAMREQAPPEPVAGPVFVRVTVYQGRPRGHYGTGRNGDRLRENAPRLPVAGRDLDKVLRAILDAGTGVWWSDDSRVVDLAASRLYAGAAGERTEVAAGELHSSP